MNIIKFDGDYSARERKCIEAQRKLFAELKTMKAQQYGDSADGARLLRDLIRNGERK